MKRLHVNETSRPLNFGKKIVRPPCIIEIKNELELKQFLLMLKTYNIKDYWVEDVEAQSKEKSPLNEGIKSSQPDEVIIEELEEPKTTLEKLMRNMDV